MSETHAESVAFVRDTMLPQANPPTAQAGAVKWLRENLFSGPVNTVMTLVGLFVIWWIVTHFYDWFAHSVWNASSLAECRQIIADTWGEGARGACFAIIRERWNQFIFGFYPVEQYWRPTLAFGMLFLVLGPVLFADSAKLRCIVTATAAVLTFICCQLLGAPAVVLTIIALVLVGLIALNELAPRLALICTLLYPFAGVWLLWGGSLWTILMVLVGPFLGILAWRLTSRFGMFAVAIGVAVMILWWSTMSGQAARDLQTLMPISLPAIQSSEFGGFLLAITIGIAGIAMSLPAGIVLALARQSDLPIVKMFAVVFIEFIRGVPLITLLFVASLLLNYFLPPNTNFDIILRVIIMVTIFAAAYMAEVIRGGLAALPKGQYEAADALGLDYWKAQRLIILPQALKISIPGIVGTFIGMFKDTTLVGLIGLFDPLKGVPDFIRANFAWKGVYWEPFVFVGAIFFVICFGMSRYSMYLERRLAREHR